MISAKTLRTDLTDTAAELTRVLEAASTARSHATELHTGIAGLGARGIADGLDDLCRRLDDATAQLEAARETFASCAVELFGITGTAEQPAPAPEPVDPPEKQAAPGRGFDWLLVAMLTAGVTVALGVGSLVLDTWLDLVPMKDAVQPVVAVGPLVALAFGCLDRGRLLNPTVLALVQAGGVITASLAIIGDAAGWRELTAVPAAAAVGFLVLNLVVVIVVLRRYDAARA
ncbi:hypothetical protein Val02_50520 [Virgisporangium aliadipatigenens]|uniref:Uncharacterized protein n=1 Tax=Virgisporangium aliadipatigenens TaxID=741659 RepID=A0A8J3YMU7_9ACTN|nr:hypothetical protein [Virgisporangium aliadipatigenens]GIJ48166.1 hypothetical protein Val02_50520 [Virgisporangium aliadipatigenens]